METIHVWYRQRKIKTSGVFDTLSSTPVQWLGTIEATFKNISGTPDPVQIGPIISQYVLPLLRQYVSNPRLPSASSETRAVSTIVPNWLNSWAQSYSTMPPSAYVALEAYTLASPVAYSLSGGYGVSGLIDPQYRGAANILDALGPNVIANAVKNGVFLSEDLLIYLTHFYPPQSASPAPSLSALKQQLLDRMKQEDLESFMDMDKIKEEIMFGDDAGHYLIALRKAGMSDDEYLSTLKQAISADQKNLDHDSIFSGLSFDDFVSLMPSLDVKGWSADYFRIWLSQNSYKISSNDQKKAQSLGINELREILDGYPTDFYKWSDFFRLGIGNDEEIHDYVRTHFDRLSDYNIESVLDDSPISQQTKDEIRGWMADRKAKNSKSQSWTDAESFFAYMTNVRMIKLDLLVDDAASYAFNTFMEEAKNTGISRDEAKAYAKQIVLVRFDPDSIARVWEPSKNGKLIISGIDFLGGWAGKFAPRLALPGMSPSPVIFLKEGMSDTVDQSLIKNLGLRGYTFDQAVLQHEMSHALHYIGSGNAMMQDEVQEQAQNLQAFKKQWEEATPEEREKMRAPTMESSNTLYLTSPAETYAWAHGNIPVMQKAFESAMQDQMSSTLVGEAIRNQWVEDVMGSLAGVSAGGTNAERLKQDIAENRGWAKYPADPYSAMNVRLERETRKLKDAYVENLENQRKETLHKLRTQLKRTQEAMAKARIDHKDAQQFEADRGKWALREDDFFVEMRDFEREIDRLKREIQLAKTRQYFDSEGVAELLVKGYLQHYFRSIADEVMSSGDTGPIVPPDKDAQDLIRLRQQEQQQAFNGEFKTKPLLPYDVSELANFAIDMSRPVPGGRMIDVLTQVPRPEEERSGFFPHKTQQNAR